MLFLSIHADYTLKLRSEKPIYTPKGDLVATQPKIKAHFQHGVAPPWAVEQATRQGFVPYGRPDGHNLAPLYSVYDTDAAALIEDWDAETKEWVENRMLSNPSYGSCYIRIEFPSPQKPWPHYDRVRSAAKIAEKVREDGYDPAVVLEYERANRDRPDVAEALLALSAGGSYDEELVEA